MFLDQFKMAVEVWVYGLERSQQFALMAGCAIPATGQASTCHTMPDLTAWLAAAFGARRDAFQPCYRLHHLQKCPVVIEYRISAGFQTCVLLELQICQHFVQLLDYSKELRIRWNTVKTV
jgi:hypothetical protein